MTTFPSIADVERIAAGSDPLVRNLQITHCYHNLALAMLARSGPYSNWCTFATWASKQAGQTIRKEDLARALEVYLRSDETVQQASLELAAPAGQNRPQQSPVQVLRLIWQAWDPLSAFERSSAAVARGNLKVFAEIGREFARFYAACLGDSTYDVSNIERFCAALQPGDPPNGQEYLRKAFRHYYQAFFEPQDKARIELLLLANIEIGFHEQTRLQPEINEALSAPVIDPKQFALRLNRLLHPRRGILNDLVWYASRWIGRKNALDPAIERFTAALRQATQRLVTETLMSIELPPRQYLRLGEDLTGSFPPLLQHIANPELQALLAQIDPTPDSTSQSGAEYWGSLPDRLHFIVDLFRCYETASELFRPPFSEQQTAEIIAGRKPQGRL